MRITPVELLELSLLQRKENYLNILCIIQTKLRQKATKQDLFSMSDINQILDEINQGIKDEQL